MRRIRSCWVRPSCSQCTSIWPWLSYWPSVTSLTATLALFIWRPREPIKLSALQQ